MDRRDELAIRTIMVSLRSALDSTPDVPEPTMEQSRRRALYAALDHLDTVRGRATERGGDGTEVLAAIERAEQEVHRQLQHVNAGNADGVH